MTQEEPEYVDEFEQEDSMEGVTEPELELVPDDEVDLPDKEPGTPGAEGWEDK